jgi:hypothetical protein
MASQGETEKLEVLTDGINRLIDRLESNGQQQVVIHKQAGPGGLLAAAIAVSFSAMFFSLLVYLVSQKDIKRLEDQARDHDAYIHMQGDAIAKLKSDKGR